MDCIMGLALLRRFVVEFDHVTPRLILHERASYRPPSDMTSVPLVFRSNPTVLYVDIELTSGGAPRMFRVVPDTGAAFYGAVFVGDAMTRVRSQLPSVPAITLQRCANHPAHRGAAGLDQRWPVHDAEAE